MPSCQGPLYEQVGGELDHTPRLNKHSVPGDAWRQWIIEEKSPSIDNKSPDNVYIPNSFEKKLDDILTKLESIEKKIKVRKVNTMTPELKDMLERAVWTFIEGFIGA